MAAMTGPETPASFKAMISLEESLYTDFELPTKPITTSSPTPDCVSFTTSATLGEKAGADAAGGGAVGGAGGGVC
jgi:hypothetical protein